MPVDPLTLKGHTHYREYDPLTARWMSEDPAGYQDGLNLYAAYMGINGEDPLGLAEEIIIPASEKLIGMAEGNIVHRSIQESIVSDTINVEVSNVFSGRKGGVGRIDYVDLFERYIAEIKPSSINGLNSGLKQLKSRIGYDSTWGRKLTIYAPKKQLLPVGTSIETITLTAVEAEELLTSITNAELTKHGEIFAHANKKFPGRITTYKVTPNAVDKGSRMKLNGKSIRFKMAGGVVVAAMLATDFYTGARDLKNAVNDAFPFVGIDPNGDEFSIGWKATRHKLLLWHIELTDYYLIHYRSGPKSGTSVRISEDQYDELNDVFWKEYKKKYPRWIDRWRHQEKLIEEYERGFSPGYIDPEEIRSNPMMYHGEWA